MIHRLKKSVFAILSGLQDWMDLAKDRRLRASLGGCGKGVLIRRPVVVEVPQNVFIEDEVSIASFLHIWGNAGVTIGRRTMIASHVAITSATHDPDAEVMSETIIKRPVTIKNDVWIGTHAVIMPGVTIGEHSIVAAGSVVSEDVAPNTIVGGAPARFIREKSPGKQR